MRALAATAPHSFTADLFTTPFGELEATLLSAEPAEFANDYPSFRKAAASPERLEWQDACDDEHHNLASHDAFEYVLRTRCQAGASSRGWRPR